MHNIKDKHDLEIPLEDHHFKTNYLYPQNNFKWLTNFELIIMENRIQR